MTYNSPSELYQPQDTPELEEFLDNVFAQIIAEEQRLHPQMHFEKSDFADQSPFTPLCTERKYGYTINISHPAIKPHYDEYVKNECSVLPISDTERFLFECRVRRELDRLGISREDYEREYTQEEILKNKYDAIRKQECPWLR